MGWLDDAELAALVAMAGALSASYDRGARNPDQITALPFAWSESPSLTYERLRMRQLRATARIRLLATLAPIESSSDRHDALLVAVAAVQTALEQDRTLGGAVEDSAVLNIDTAEFPDDHRAFLLVDLEAQRIE